MNILGKALRSNFITLNFMSESTKYKAVLDLNEPINRFSRYFML